MSGRRTRELKFYLEYEYNSDTKDQIEDLLTQYSSADDIVTKAIAALHEKHFGVISTKSPPPTYSKTFSGLDDTANTKLNELWEYFVEIKEQFKPQAPVETGSNAQIVHQLSEEANEKIIQKIEELGMRFSKIIPKGEQTTERKTTEMSKEEVLQLIKRIDQLESKLTRAISQSRVATTTAAPTRRGTRDLGEAPKIGIAKAIDGPPLEPEDRPLLDDVLNTVIVSVDKDDE
ncbi:MAG: hypothetical protein KGD59_01875 [Candidatus Heimdallarchaeota archaeon]|nr:hypothetical protein [Candidatus Heimdallarchaeota archaeon]MBY8993268.1 hypothetical protein [Candidatus Heimdallarchaeota archaeon]